MRGKVGGARAVDASIESGGYACGTRGPEDPDQTKEYRMASNADDGGTAMSGVEEEGDVDD